MLPCGTDGRTTSEDRATQLLICEALSLAIVLSPTFDIESSGLQTSFVFDSDNDSCDDHHYQNDDTYCNLDFGDSNQTPKT